MTHHDYKSFNSQLSTVQFPAVLLVYIYNFIAYFIHLFIVKINACNYYNYFNFIKNIGVNSYVHILLLHILLHMYPLTINFQGFTAESSLLFKYIILGSESI